MVFPTLNLKNNVLIEFLSEDFFVFLSTYIKYPVWSVITKSIDSCKEDQMSRQSQSQLDYLGSKNKKGNYSGRYFYSFRSGT